jgi:hypothetical protein
MRNLSLLVLAFASLPLVGGCEGGSGTGPGNGSDDSGPGPDDSGSEEISAPFTVVLPDGISGKVTVWEGDEGGAEKQVGSCDADAVQCTYTASKAGVYWVIVEAENALFLAKTVEADRTGAFPDVVSWETGGCQDEGWTPSLAVCESWTPGEWGLAPNGWYFSEEWDTELITAHSPDVDGDGIPDIKLTIEASSEHFVMSGSVGRDINQEGWDGIVAISNDLSMVILYLQGDKIEFLAE